MLLAGDIGGTKTALALFSPDDLRTPLELQSFPSRDYTGLEQIVQEYLASHSVTIQGACFGLAGPVVDGRCQTINLPWVVEQEKLGSLLGTSHIMLVNDLEAMAWSLELLREDDLHTIHAGRLVPGNRAVIAAGTGLGEAGIWHGRFYHPFASEGGHADFSPQTYEEDALLGFLRNKFQHVSWERVLSGPGIENIYEFLVNTYRVTPSVEIHKQMQSQQRAAVITGAALQAACPACLRTMELFVSLYGAEAGNLALKLMATGGIYIGGGIAPKILPLLDSDQFRSAFVHKGRLTSVLQQVPVHVIMTNQAPLLGAAHVSNLLLTGRPIH